MLQTPRAPRQYRNDPDYLHSCWRRSGSTADHDAVIISLMPRVRGIALTVWRRTAQRLELEDMISAGNVGMIEAVARFDPERGLVLETFSYIRVSGALLDFIRSRSLLSRPQLRFERRRITAEAEFGRQGRAPLTDAQLADALDMDVAAVVSTRTAVQHRRMRSLDREMLNDVNGMTLADIIEDRQADVPARVERRAALRVLTQALADLPPRERLVLRALVGDGRTLADVGAELGVSESRASQLAGAGRSRLRGQLGDLTHAG